MRSMLTSALVAIALLAPRTTLAAPPIIKQPSSDTVVAQAKELYKQGVALFDTGDFAGALEKFDAVAKLMPAKAAFQYNRGTCLQKLNRYTEAKAAFEKYLELDPKAEDKGAITERIALLDTLIKQAKPVDPSPASDQPLVEDPAFPPAPPPPPSKLGLDLTLAPMPIDPPTNVIPPITPLPAPDTPRTPLYKRWWLWTAVGVVVAGVVVTGVIVGTQPRDPGPPGLTVNFGGK